MNIRSTVRTLAVAALLAVTVVSVSAPRADAKPIRDKQTQGPVVVDTLGQNITCDLPGSTVGQPQYDHVFYSLGDRILVNGESWMCTSIGGGIGSWRH